ncbi:enhancer of split M1 protein [Culicoides brevitarsis]|uniref:enhancer of split M1 protein n=1 Tax=Culicoides brevitarsis TaxID=469753 RepID=UPI00307BD642
MKLILLTLAVFAVACIYATPLDKPEVKACMKKCPSDYKPLCAKEASAKQPTTFGNSCVLENYKCESGKVLEVIKQDECDGNAPVRL